MGRRQIKIRQHEIGPDVLLPYLGEEVDVVRSDRTTFHGKLTACSNHELKLETANSQWYNRSVHQVTIPISDIQYVYHTTITNY